MKKAILVTVLALLFAVPFIMPSNAWFYPGAVPSDDGKSNNFGPITPNLLLTPYGSQTAEYEAYLGCSIDFMDWPFLASQVHDLNFGPIPGYPTGDTNMDTYARAFYVDRGMREFDLNNMKFPTNDVYFRKAMALAFPKSNFIATQLAGLALKMDSPLAWSEGWYNKEYCENYYQFSLADAANMLTAHGYTDQDTDGWREGPGGEKIVLDIYCRADDPDRSAMGHIECANLISIGVNVNEIQAPKSTCFQKVMVEFDYHAYTGGWSFGRDPDTLYFLYRGDIAQAYPYTQNYPGYQNPTFDMHAFAMLTAAVVGDKDTECTAKYHVFRMQELMTDDCCIIPVFTYASYGGYKTGWQKVCNAEGTGPYSYYTFMNTFKEGTNTIRWGQMNDIETLNVIHSEWVWDWNILGLVYDGLINVDPYDMSHDLPWIAKNWEVGEWTYGAETCTTVTFKLREDVYWQDIPADPNRKTPGGKPLLQEGAFNMPLTADDVVSSIYIVRDVPDSWNHDAVADVLYAEKIDPYTVKFYFDVFMPLWAMHWVGGIPIVPKHVWEPIFEEGNTRTFDPVATKCLAGSGIWYFDYAASSPTNYYMLRANTKHQNYHPIDLYADVNKLKRLDPCQNITISFYWHNRDDQHTYPASDITAEIWVHVPVDSEAILPNGTKILLPACTEVKIWEASNPTLPFCEKIFGFNITIHVKRGLSTIRAVISPDPITGHTDFFGYPVFLWGTISEDINMDFYVNAKDAVSLGVSFGTAPGAYYWNPACDINHDGYVNAKDAVMMGTKFNWPL